MRPPVVRQLVVLGIVLAAGCRMTNEIRRPGAAAGPRLTHGVAAGEVTATSVVVWGRCDRAADLTVVLRDPAADGEWSQRTAVTGASDFTGRVRFDELRPDTAYEYRVTCGGGGGDRHGSRGRLRTAPATEEARPVRFVWSGDLGGQNVCRDLEQGYPIFAPMAAVQPAFFVALGDMIYAGDGCQPIGRYGNEQIPGPPTPATSVAAFQAIWRYNRADRGFQRFLAATPMYAVWDDHEIMNDAGPGRDVRPQAPGVPLLPIARQAFLDYQPMLPPSGATTRLFRSVRWGKHLSLFLLDTRSYRDRNDRPDDAAAPKTLLGAEQGRWLIDALRASDATWKVIVCSVPLSIPTGTRGRDGFASGDGDTGFERELVALLGALEQNGVRNLLWITTDVHFATGFRDRPFADRPEFVFHELAVGPLNAGVFPITAVDPTLRPERLFFYGPRDPLAIDDFDAARAWFSFGIVDVSETGLLAVRVVNGDGVTVYTTTLTPR